MGNVKKFKGKYVPDKDGKLRPVLRLTDININLSDSHYHYRHHPGFNLNRNWFSGIWNWFKKIFWAKNS